MFKQLTAIACSYYQRLGRKIRHILRSLHQQVSVRANAPNNQADPFLQQQGLMFCSRFPKQPLRPNALLLNQGSTDAFWYRLTGHAKGHYSLAIVNRALASALYRKSNAQTCFVPFDDGLKKSVDQMPKDTDPTLKQAINNSAPVVPDRPIVSIVHHYPVIIDKDPADIRLIIFFWEESLVPTETISILNENFDGILVASSFVATVLRNSGCAIPVFVIPMGIDHIVDFSAPLVPLPPINDDKLFRFLHVSSVFERKGPEFLLAAFIDQFDAEDPVELYIKTFPNPHNRIHEQLAYFASTKPNPPRVIIDEAEISSKALQALYRSAHTLVLPTRGEGFNLPAAEALALGLPVIVTGFGAQTDFSTVATASLIPFRFDLSRSHLNQGDGCWVTPEVRALALLMQQSVDEIKSANTDQLNQRRAAGHALMRSTYTWDQAAQGISNALHWLAVNATVKQDVAIKHVNIASQMDIVNLTVEIPHQDALMITLQSHHLDDLLLKNSPNGLLQALHTLSKLDKILILELLTIPDFTKLQQTPWSEAKIPSALALFKNFDRIIVQNVLDLNKMLICCEPSSLMLLTNHSNDYADQNINSARNLRLENMVKGLKRDRQFKLS